MVDGYYHYALDICMKLSNDKILLKVCGPPLKQIEGGTEKWVEMKSMCWGHVLLSI